MIFTDSTWAPVFATLCGTLGIWLFMCLKKKKQKPSYFHNSFGSLTSIKCLGLTAIGMEKPTETKRETK